jgi:hypothetical protein
VVLRKQLQERTLLADSLHSRSLGCVNGIIKLY